MNPAILDTEALLKHKSKIGKDDSMNENAAPANKLRLINMQEVEAQEIKWLWYPYIVTFASPR